VVAASPAAIATRILWALESPEENQRAQFVKELRDRVTDAVPDGAVERVLELLLYFRLVEQE
jgi:hypothetical protein